MAAKALIDGVPKPVLSTDARADRSLRQAIVAHAKRFYGLDFNPDTDVVVTSGATEALTASIMGLVGQGGEVVLIDPAYDLYPPIAEAMGAVVRRAKLAPPDYRLHEDLLRMPPSRRRRKGAGDQHATQSGIGRVFDREELETIARVVRDSDANVICDEVYEHLVFDGRPQIPLMTLPGMRERCVRVGSAGKMFSLTGWKIGWVTGAPAPIDAIAKAHQFITFTTARPRRSLAIAYALEKEIDFTLELTKTLQGNDRDALRRRAGPDGLQGALPSRRHLLPHGRYLGPDQLEPDIAFCERIVKEAWRRR